jgi:palmitoyltransferase
MRTYDYILAMREVNESMELDPFDDSDFSSDSDFDSPKKSTIVSRFICGHRGNQVHIRLPTLILHFEQIISI